MRNGFLGSLFCLLSALAAALSAADERGGSFTLMPAALLPTGRLAQTHYPGPQANLDFDIGINPSWSVLFGAGYAELEHKLTPEARLLLAPAWFGFKHKAQLGPSVEIFWDFAGELFYEKQYYIHSGNGSTENLDGGMMLGAGFDLWLTNWLLAGVETRMHFIVEPGEIFPMMQLGLRLGLRG
jgi:hypothetical protein